MALTAAASLTARPSLTQDEAFARIRLLRSPNVGPVSYAQLMRRFGTAAQALEALPDLAARGGARYRVADAGRVETEIAAVRRAGARYLFHDSPDYPPLLRESDSAPPIVTVRGDAAIAARPVVAIVGARNSSAAAVKLARDFAAALAEAGFAVVSGLARGIDSAAHRGALSAGGGSAGGGAAGGGAAGMPGGGTVGVIASGIDIAYPPENVDLQAQVAAEGLLIAEQPPGTEPLARHFPSRNRIIAGIAAGTLVVEAAPKSGSLITARLAAEAGREVMAIPGSPLDSRSHGCNQLIRDGAVLVQRPEDVIELLSGFDGTPRSRVREPAASWLADMDTSSEQAVDDVDIATLLTVALVSIDELIRQSGAGASAVQYALLELEIAGRLVRHAAGRVSLSS